MKEKILEILIDIYCDNPPKEGYDGFFDKMCHLEGCVDGISEYMITLMIKCATHFSEYVVEEDDVREWIKDYYKEEK